MRHIPSPFTDFLFDFDRLVGRRLMRLGKNHDLQTFLPLRLANPEWNIDGNGPDILASEAPHDIILLAFHEIFIRSVL
jgi:hypothetical protein